MSSLLERSADEKAFTGRAGVYESAFDKTTHQVTLDSSHLNKLVTLYTESLTTNYTVTLPPASKRIAGQKINLIGPDAANIIVNSTPVSGRVDTIIGVSLKGRGEFVVLNFGGGDYNWETRMLDRIGTGGSAPGGTVRDPYEVDAAKRKEVVDADVPAYLETNTDYYGKSFVDEVYGPGRPAKYDCLPSAPAVTGGATVWKWFRSDIL